MFRPPYQLLSTNSLTVVDSDGATNSTTASLTVNKAVDYPPVANAGPNQVITLPQNSITLFGNQSTDDHGIASYEWSLSPGSKGKVVEMQVGACVHVCVSGHAFSLNSLRAQGGSDFISCSAFISAPFYSQRQACAFRFLKSPPKIQKIAG